MGEKFTLSSHDFNRCESGDYFYHFPKLQSDKGIVLSEILKCAVQPRAAGDLHTGGNIGEDALATGLDKLTDLRVNG
jgi:hypothetical protein